MDDLERAMQRLAVVERRLERLESLLNDKYGPLPQLLHPVPPAARAESRFLDSSISSMQFPELRLELVDPPQRPAAPCTGSSFACINAAVEQYTHLIEPLCALWGHPEFDRFVSRLIVNERGSRRGFSAEVMDELLFLASLNQRLCTSTRILDPWEDPQFVSDRL